MPFRLKSKSVAVLGAGSWGTTVAIHLYNRKHIVRLWEYFSENVTLMNRTRKNPLLEGIPIPSEIPISNQLDEVIQNVSFIIIAVPSQTVRSLLEKMRGKVLKDVIIINLSKGIERGTLKRMSEVIREVLDHPTDKIVTLHGPSHAEEVSREVPTAVVAASTSPESAQAVQKLFMSSYFRVYTNSDIVGVEVGGAIKNIIAIASGICDGMNLGDNSKAALITRGLLEITRIGMMLGGKEETFAGLSGVGDLIVTCGSKHSRNRYVGEEIGKGRKLKDILAGMTMVAEGVETCQTVHEMVSKYGAVMPISEEIYKVLFENKDPHLAVHHLMNRDPVMERHSIPKK
ncbi:MAG: NAD(P)H-dependent glycerol-3-phosphate dehydrogenase [Candidatus Marinimicrobia bacterium CG08_land_8_20_14_0_20_45_22]|nr:MAG: NAD(P)H-dependent glycerol-3-phosphate dehydrogenase [Candidatus Marinimicrobia bacterium CG08_land_8_20_14_0_20_45_22]